MTEKELRDRAVLGAMHPGLFDVEVEVAGGPQFDGGVRADTHRPDPTLRTALRPHSYREPGGWRTLELENGADLFFGATSW